MEVREELKEIIEKAKDAAVAAGELPEGDYAPVQRLEVPKEKEFGDYSTNAAMQWARTAHKAPRQIAAAVVKHIDTPWLPVWILRAPDLSISSWPGIRCTRN